MKRLGVLLFVLLALSPGCHLCDRPTGIVEPSQCRAARDRGTIYEAGQGSVQAWREATGDRRFEPQVEFHDW